MNSPPQSISLRSQVFIHILERGTVYGIEKNPLEILRKPEIGNNNQNYSE